jgi:plastocyanin
MTAGGPASTSRAALALAVALALAGCGGGAVPAQTLPAPADPGTPKLAITAENVAFAQTEVGVAANTAFILALDNRDAVPLNVSISRDGGERRFEGAVFSGPGSRWYAVPALAAGTYTFVCDVHPNMTGRLIAS